MQDVCHKKEGCHRMDRPRTFRYCGTRTTADLSRWIRYSHWAEAIAIANVWLTIQGQLSRYCSSPRVPTRLAVRSAPGPSYTSAQQFPG